MSGGNIAIDLWEQIRLFVLWVAVLSSLHYFNEPPTSTTTTATAATTAATTVLHTIPGTNSSTWNLLDTEQRLSFTPFVGASTELV